MISERPFHDTAAGSRRPNAPMRPAASAPRDNYQVAVSSRRTSSGTIPTLKVVRLSDKRVIYPFTGCGDMPLFEDAQSARVYAEAYGWTLVDGDIAVPE
ncbi:MAG: DUF6723 family protein [Pararobbsia sp.]